MAIHHLIVVELPDVLATQSVDVRTAELAYRAALKDVDVPAADEANCLT